MHYTEFDCKRLRISERKKNIKTIEAFTLHCDLDLEDSNQPFRTTLRVMVMHNHTKVDCIQSSGSEDIFWTKV